MSTYCLTKHCLLNNFIIDTLECEYEKLRQSVLERDAAGLDIEIPLRWFTKYGRKLDQARRLKHKLITKEVV